MAWCGVEKNRHPDHTILCHAVPCHAVPSRAMPCHAMPCSVVPYCTIACLTVPHHAMPHHTILPRVLALTLQRGPIPHMSACTPVYPWKTPRTHLCTGLPENAPMAKHNSRYKFCFTESSALKGRSSCTTHQHGPVSSRRPIIHALVGMTHLCWLPSGLLTWGRVCECPAGVARHVARMPTRP